MVEVTDDGTGTLSDTATVKVNVTDVNDTAPVITGAQSFEVAEDAADATSVGTAVATDADTTGSLQSWTITAGNDDQIFAIDGGTGQITVADNTNLDRETTGTYVLTLTVGDGVNTSDTETVTINVTDVNDTAPVITEAQSFDVAEDAAYATSVGTAVATDEDTTGSQQSWTITAGNEDDIFAIDGGTGQITVADNTNLDRETIDTYELTLTVGDGMNTSDTETVTINVTDVNDAPTAEAGDNQVVNEGDIVTLDANGSSDAEDRELTYTWTQIGGTAVALSDANALQATFAAPEGLVNSDLTFQVSVSDGTNNSTDAVIITVNAVNDAPTASAGTNQEVDSGDAVTLNAGDSSDPEGKELTYAWTQTAGNAVALDNINASRPTFTIPGGLSNVTLTFEVAVSDGTNISTDTVDVVIAPRNIPASVEVEPIDEVEVEKAPEAEVVDQSGSEKADEGKTPIIVEEESRVEETEEDTELIVEEETKVDDTTTPTEGKDGDVQSGTDPVPVNYQPVESASEAPVRETPDSGKPKTDTSTAERSSSDVTNDEEPEIPDDLVMDNVSNELRHSMDRPGFIVESKYVETKMWQALDVMKPQMSSDEQSPTDSGVTVEKIAVGSVAGLTTLAAGYATWFFRGISMVTSLLTTLPLWRSFDPLPILDAAENKPGKREGNKDYRDKNHSEEEEKIDSLFEQSEASNNGV
jgi:carbon monoxide dehydrogenase subunit G